MSEHVADSASRALTDIAQLLGSTEGSRERLLRSLELLRRAVACDCSALVLRRRQSDTPQLLSMPELLATEQLALAARLTPLIDLDSASEPRAAGVVDNHLALPIVGHDEVIGVLFVERGSAAFPFEEGELRVLTVVAAQLGNYVVSVESQAEAAQLDQFKAEMFSVVVHDLKNPLSVITTNTEYLLSALKDLPEDAFGALDDIRAASNRMVRMVANLLDLHRLESKTLQPVCEEIDLTDLLQKIAQERRLQAKTRQLTIVTRIEATTLHADRDLIVRVIENVLDNALRHTPKGGTIEMRAAVQNDQLQLDIGNSGPAVPERFRQAIFEKYGQAATGSRLNLGLGLYFCKLAVESHAGRMWVDSLPDLPTVFRIELPRRGPSGG